MGSHHRQPPGLPACARKGAANPGRRGTTGGNDRGDTSAARGQRARRALWIALVANALFLVVEVVGGIAFGSLALLADAAHMLSDVGGLGIALVAQRLTQRPVSAKHSFGLERAEVIGAQANGVLLLASAGWIAWEAVQRFSSPTPVAGLGLLLVASGGLAVNLGSAWLLARARDRSLNMRGAFLHMMADAVGSVGAIGAGAAVLAFGATWVDPAVSLLIVALVVWAAWGLLRDATHVLLEGAPKGLEPQAVERALTDAPHVESVHHLHLWTLASDLPAMSAHITLEGVLSLHDAQACGQELKALLGDRFGIAHVTLELECHECEPDRAVPPPGDPAPSADTPAR